MQKTADTIDVPPARRLLEDGRGALARTLALIAPLLPD